MSIKIITNGHLWPLIDASELTEAERAELTYEPDGLSFVRYRDELYALADFSGDWGITRGSGLPDAFRGSWTGYLSDSFFSGVVIRLLPDDDDHVVMGRFYATDDEPEAPAEKLEDLGLVHPTWETPEPPVEKDSGWLAPLYRSQNVEQPTVVIDKHYVNVGERFEHVMPHSEVCMHLGIAGKVMGGELTEGHMVQLYRPAEQGGERFSFPVTAGEAGLYHDGRFYFHLAE